METVGMLIRLIVGIAFAVYGVICIICGFARAGGCLMHLINLAAGPILTGLMVLLFPEIVDEVFEMNPNGMLIIAVLFIMYIVPVILGCFDKERLAGLLNGIGFISVGMVLSGVIPGPIIMFLVGIVVKLFGILGIPWFIIMFFFHGF